MSIQPGSSWQWGQIESFELGIELNAKSRLICPSYSGKVSEVWKEVVLSPKGDRDEQLSGLGSGY